MSNNYFSFRNFTIVQDKTAMKVGTDGVLLGAWVKLHNAINVLDIGAGTGLIAMMIADKYPQTKITAVEIEDFAAAQAKENIIISGFDIDLINKDIREFDSLKYDLIISNPPFFKDSLKSPNNKRTLARHTDNLSYKDLYESVFRLLAEHGRFALIIPYFLGEEIVSTFKDLMLSRRTIVFPKTGKSPNRLLLEFSKEKLLFEEDIITIRDSEDLYTNEYKKLLDYWQIFK